MSLDPRAERIFADLRAGWTPDRVTRIFADLKGDPRLKRPPCTACGAPERLLGRSWCRQCCSEYARLCWLVRTQSPETRQRVRARVAAYNALRRGEIVTEPCNRCGAAGEEMHHPDYSKPLDVDRLCHRCHADETYWEHRRAWDARLRV